MSVRCSQLSQQAGEEVLGTASQVRTFLLVEAPGAWGVDALEGARLDPEVRAWLRGLAGQGVRPLVIRGHGRQRRSGTRVFGCNVGRADGTRGPVLGTALLDDPRELLDLPVAELADGGQAGLEPTSTPVVGVCTHGRHDACCAELGRPLCRALHAVDPDHVWEISHIGGDRFAPNLLVLPWGLYYGRVQPEDAEDFLATVHRGELDLAHLRGRSVLPFAAQAAEVYLRRRLGLLDAAALPVRSLQRDGGLTRVVFAAAGERWRVEVRSDRFDPRQLTCRAAAPAAGPEHHLVSLEAA